MRPYWGLIAFLDLGNCCFKPKSCPGPVVSSPYGKSLLTAHVLRNQSSEEKQVLISIASLTFCCLFLQSQVLVSWSPVLVCSNSAAKAFLSYQCYLVSLVVRAVNCHNKTLNPGGFGICCPLAGACVEL